MSQAIIQMGLVFGVIQVANKYGLDAPENALYLRISYSAVQLINLALIAYIYSLIQKKKDTKTLVYNESKNMFDPADVEVIQTTVQEYDISQVKSLLTQTLLAIGIIGFMHFRLGYMRPLLLQSVLGLRSVYSVPLFQVHVLGKAATGQLARPWKNPMAGNQTPSTPKELKAKEKKEAKKKINRID